MPSWKNRPSLITIPVACHRDEDLVNYMTDEGRELPSDLCHELYEAGIVDWGNIVLHVLSSGYESRDENFEGGYDRDEERLLARAEIALPDGARRDFSAMAVKELAEFFAKQITPNAFHGVSR